MILSSRSAPARDTPLQVGSGAPSRAWVVVALLAALGVGTSSWAAPGRAISARPPAAGARNGRVRATRLAPPRTSSTRLGPTRTTSTRPLGLRQAQARLIRKGTNPTIAARAARHVLLGLPSDASRDKDQDLLLVRNGYVLSYNASRNAMNWASWSIEPGDLGGVGRQKSILDRKTGEHVSVFRPDPTLPEGFYRPEHADYVVEPGFTRGHMVRSGERTASLRENRKTFLFSNMLPQSRNNNNGPWNAFENYYRDMVEKEGLTAHVIAGGIFGAAPVAARGVAVPSETWKIVALLKPGQGLANVDEHTRVIAVRMPNDNVNIQIKDPWGRFRVSVGELERSTGLRFFDHLPAGVANRLRGQVDAVAVDPPPARPRPVFEPVDPGSSQAGRIVGRQARGVVRSYSAARGLGVVVMANGQEMAFRHQGDPAGLRDGAQVTLDVALRHDGRPVVVNLRALARAAQPVTPLLLLPAP